MTTAKMYQQKRADKNVSWWLRRVAVVIVMFIVVAVGVTLIAGARAKAALAAAYPPIGQMVDVGGYKLHLYCQGTGSPTVVMDAGAGSTGLFWSLVQPEIAATVRACVYDRAGYGWSEKSPRPRSIEVLVDELHSLLANADVPGPYLLVGHSIGGIVVRQYAHSYPSEVVGMVLVDSAQEQQFQRFPAEIVSATNRGLAQSRILGWLIATGFPALFPGQVPLESELPLEAAEAYRALLLSDSKHLATFRDEIGGVERGDTEPVTSLGTLPLIVLIRGRPEPVEVSTDVSELYEQTSRQLQVELAALSSNGQRIVADQSGHNIHLEQPQLVIGAIQETAEAANR